MFFSNPLASPVTLFCISVKAHQFISDPGVCGRPLEVVHAYYDQWPTGVAVSSNGRLFSSYPSGLDGSNTNNGTNGRYQLAELTSVDKETPYPDLQWNSPTGGAINYTTSPPTGANYRNHFISVQTAVIDSNDRLWALDTGRAIDPTSTIQVQSSYGGPKLVGFDLSTNQIFKTILFPTNVAFPESYLNDVRFDLRPEVTNTTGGVAYITDSSAEGRNGLIVVDLDSGESWRRLTGSHWVAPELAFVPFIWGAPVYSSPLAGSGIYNYFTTGSDGIAISADGEDIYFSALASRTLYSVPSALLRDRSAWSEVRAVQGVRNCGQKGFSDGLETDTNGFIYAGNFELNAITFYNPANGTSQIFVRDPRINWVDTMSVGTDGYLYFTVNGVHRSEMTWSGGVPRTKPWALFRAKLPDNGGKVLLK